MLRSGSLTERVGILLPVVDRGKFGEQEVTYSKEKTVWANVVYQKGAPSVNLR